MVSIANGVYAKDENNANETIKLFFLNNKKKDVALKI